jgi:MFS family permease
MAVSADPATDVAPAGVRFRIVGTVAAGAFVTSFDSSAVAAALPLLREAFGVPICAIQWVVTAALAVTTGLLLVFGQLGDLAGHRRVYLCGFGAFVPGCVLCGASGSLRTLIAWRVFQGFGSAMLLASSPAILARERL